VFIAFLVTVRFNRGVGADEFTLRENGRVAFATTRWSVVLTAQTDSP
jgi:hypothetical protein